MKREVTSLVKVQSNFIRSKDIILSDWMGYDSPKKILKQHDIESQKFISDFGGGVFDYFMGVISGVVEIGSCPVMQKLLAYLKDRDISADELFEICSHFRRAMIDFSYDAGISSKEVYDDISYIFDKNFRGILKYYTDTIFQKEQEIDRNVKLLSEYKKALDESALISKTDLNGNITYVNDKFVELCGFERSELMGKKHNIMRHHDMSEEYFRNLWDSLKKNNLYKGTIKNLKKNGEYFYIDTTIVKITDPHENIPQYMAISYDVTKLVDARLEALNASQAKEYFLSNMSHEIRTPLNAILGFVNLLIDEDISKKHRRYLDIILTSGENLLSIINGILDFSKLRSGEFTIDPKIFSVHEEISHTMELFVASASSKNITITSFIDPTIPSEILSDPLRITQILSNFLSNAIKFTPDGGIISVEATCENDILNIKVKDNGIGISKEDLKQIFTAFAQVKHSPNVKNYGTGLGLSICHQLAKHMNGEVTANSALGKGSTFRLKIPVEIKNTTCKTLDEIQNFKALKIAVYAKDDISLQKHEAFLKYAEIFDMNTAVIDNLNSDGDYDITIFINCEIDENVKSHIKKSDRKYIALMRKFTDEYDKYSHIVPMYFPLYCSKIYSTFEELLYENSSNSYSKKSSHKFIGHILVAEDNEANQELIKILLEKYDLTFDLANNGLEAVELYKQNRYDLILMDEQMPVMDGIEAVKNILEYEELKSMNHTPVSALTANVIKGAREIGLLSGFDSFLGKPIILKELEKVFLKYLKINKKDKFESGKQSALSNIKGLDVKKLREELLLNDDELLMLVKLFTKKMQKNIPELKDAIKAKDYEKIALMAHSIKGSSANFRLEVLQNNASEMETMAKTKSSDYDYETAFDIIKERVDNIKIV